jgi:hypothetical protein
MSQNANSPQNNNKVRGRKKLSSPLTACTWCAEHKTPLKYVLPTQNGKKEFCSESCIAEFRKAYSKGACIQCDNVIRTNAPNREYCSAFCMNKHQKKNGATTTTQSTTATATSSNHNNTSSGTTVTTPTTGKTNSNNVKLLGENNNNNHSKDLSNNRKSPGINRVSPVTTTSTGGPFQYESFHVFNWDEYLKVSA